MTMRVLAKYFLRKKPRMNNQEKLSEVIEKLIALGADANELQFWREIFDALTDTEQNTLLTNLLNEYRKLSSSKE